MGCVTKSRVLYILYIEDHCTVSMTRRNRGMMENMNEKEEMERKRRKGLVQVCTDKNLSCPHLCRQCPPTGSFCTRTSIFYLLQYSRNIYMHDASKCKHLAASLSEATVLLCLHTWFFLSFSLLHSSLPSKNISSFHLMSC